MTDKMTPHVTNEERMLAREWAEAQIFHDRQNPAAAAARVILNAVPAPTMEDMTPEERAECRWMQCDVEDCEGRAVILLPNATGGSAILTDRGGSVIYEDHASITPRPDLPRLEWPGDKKAAPTPAPSLPDGWRLADHPRYGRVFVTTPEPDGDGDLWFIDPSADPGGMEDWCDPDVLKFLDDQEVNQPVPPNTLTVGSVWHDVDALARACEESGRDQIVVSEHGGCIFVWDEMAEWWEGSAPPRYTPCTIIHSGREADQ